MATQTHAGAALPLPAPQPWEPPLQWEREEAGQPGPHRDGAWAEGLQTEPLWRGSCSLSTGQSDKSRALSTGQSYWSAALSHDGVTGRDNLLQDSAIGTVLLTHDGVIGGERLAQDSDKSRALSTRQCALMEQSRKSQWSDWRRALSTGRSYWNRALNIGQN